MISPEGFRGLRVAVIGAAREGTALAGALVHWGAEVTLSDIKSAEALEKHLSRLEGLDLRLALGGELPDLRNTDVLMLSPGVPPSAPVVRDARSLGLPISSEPRLFTQLCSAPIVGITGSSGKTTTTTLTGKMYAAEGRNVWVGGNIGTPLIDRLLTEEDPDVAVLELSSYQLELFSPEYQGPAVEQRRSEASRAISVTGWSPRVAAITGITPNHLDRHSSMDEYARAKSNILAHQDSGDWAVLNLDNERTREMVPQARGRVLLFSLQEPVSQGAFLRADALVLRSDGRERTICDRSEIRLRGQHNLANVLAAACCSAAGGASLGAIRSVATSFTGVPHRLEVVRRRGNVMFVNDSIATSPERAIAALRSYAEPLVLLAGGRDKHLPWDQWADLVLQRVRAVVAFGEATPIIERALVEARARQYGVAVDQTTLHCTDSLERAVGKAVEIAVPGDVVLLSPGGTSFDAFEDFEARGRRFRELVAAL